MKKLIYILMIGFCFTLVSCATLSGNKSSNQRFNIKYEIIENKDKIDIIKEKVSVDINSMSNEELKNIITNIKKLILE